MTAKAKRLTTRQAWQKLNDLSTEDMGGMVIRIAKVAREEVAESFLQGMVDRMVVSYFKYGKIRDAYGRGVAEPLQAVETLRLCLDAYAKDGNTEHLIDAANYAMIEFIRPLLPNAHFTPTDAAGSVGRVNAKGNVTTRGNLAR